MRKLLLLAVVGTLPLAGCKNESTPPPPSQPTAGTPATPTTPATYEVACASCIYKVPGASSCVPAVKVDGKTLLLSGATLNIHEVGGCKAPLQATVEGGKVEGDKFVATKVEIKK
jgi:hypothetical protein